MDSDVIQGAYDRVEIFLHHMGVNFRSFYIRMPHQFLNDADIDAILQEMGCEAVPTPSHGWRGG